jgi:hypothetical protein
MLRWYFGGSLIKALGRLFPELTFDVSKFGHAPRIFFILFYFRFLFIIIFNLLQ